MDQKELQEKIALYYSKLPPKLQEVFSSMSWLDTLKKITGKYGLNDGQIETLGTETTLVLLGIIHPEDYESILRNELVMPQEFFSRMLVEIRESVLGDITPELKETFHTNTGVSWEEKQKLDERFDKLSKEIQDAIIDSNYHEVLYQIAENSKLTIEQMGTLEKCTTDVMLGITHAENFEDSLRKNLKLPSEKIATMVDEINEKILKSIRMKTMAIRSQHKDQANTFTAQINQNETKVLGEAGIEILNNADLNTPEISAPSKPENVPPSSPLAQKLADSFKIPSTKTEHKLDNISKPAIAYYPPKSDPYRINPEE